MELKEGISSKITALTLRLNIIGKDRKFFGFAPIFEARKTDIVWAKNNELIQKTKSEIIVCKEPVDKNKTFIVTENPRLAYMQILGLYAKKVGITKNYILGKNCQIAKRTVIYDNVKIGDNCIIHPGCVIGSEGFGFEPDKNGKLIKFPHIGGVIIGDDVEIQAMTNIDRGTLGNTIIGNGTKIDTHCHIGHNTKIGNNCIICAKTQTGGSNIIGNNVFLAPNTIIRTGGIMIGDKVFAGVGSLIVKDIKSGEKVMGHPAKPF